MTRKKILVIGANGFTGRRILDDLSHNVFYQTTGCSLHDDICPHSGNYRFIRTDICNRQAVEKLFQEVQPDVVINTSALSVPDYCETHHAEADAVNITAVEHLAECCEAGAAVLSIFPPTSFSVVIRTDPIRRRIFPLPLIITATPNWKVRNVSLPFAGIMPSCA